MTAAGAPRHRALLAVVGVVALAVVLGLQVQYSLVDGYVTGEDSAVLSAAGLAWAVSVVAPASGALLACVLGAPARTALRAQGHAASHLGRTIGHVLVGSAVALAGVALVPALVGDRACAGDECGFTQFFYAVTLGSCAVLAACTGLLLLALTGSGVDRTAAGQPG